MTDDDLFQMIYQELKSLGVDLNYILGSLSQIPRQREVAEQTKTGIDRP